MFSKVHHERLTNDHVGVKITRVSNVTCKIWWKVVEKSYSQLPHLRMIGSQMGRGCWIKLITFVICMLGCHCQSQGMDWTENWSYRCLIGLISCPAFSSIGELVTQWVTHWDTWSIARSSVSPLIQDPREFHHNRVKPLSNNYHHDHQWSMMVHHANCHNSPPGPSYKSAWQSASQP